MISIKDIYETEISEEILKVAEKYSLEHIKADSHETPIFQTNEYKNKLIGYIGQIAFKQFVKSSFGLSTEFPEVNLDGSPDIYDFKINGKTIDVKTLLWNRYWGEESHKNWSIETGKITSTEDLLNKFYFLIPQIQLGLDDSLNSSFNFKKKKNKPKDVYWAIFVKEKDSKLVGGKVYILGWVNYSEILQANEKKSFFRFSPRYHTNIAIPLKNLNTNKSFI